MTLRDEILQTMNEHRLAPLDYVALFMFLNTVAGGHYQERCGEEELRSELRRLWDDGLIEARGEKGERLGQFDPGVVYCQIALAA